MSIHGEPSNARHRFKRGPLVRNPKKRATGLLLIAVLAVGSPVFAQDEPTLLTSSFAMRLLAAEPAPGALNQAIARSVQQWLLTPARTRSVANTQEATQQRGWVRRHPALFGALLGAGVGAGVGYGLGQNCTGHETEPCSSKGRAALIGAGLFAAGGALVGLAVDRASK